MTDLYIYIYRTRNGNILSRTRSLACSWLGELYYEDMNDGKFAFLLPFVRCLTSSREDLCDIVHDRRLNPICASITFCEPSR